MMFRAALRCKRVGALVGTVVCLAAMLALFVLATPGASSQLLRQGYSERITNFDSTLVVQRDGSVQVTEVITYDFGAEQRHGILRRIPTRFDWTGEIPDGFGPGAQLDRVTPIDQVSVSNDDGASDELSVETEANLTQFRVGSADAFVTGQHTYTLRYRIAGVLNAFAEYDELYFNASGNEWEVPIDRVRTVVRVPGSPTAVQCYAGPQGYTEACESAERREGGAEFVQSNLLPGAGLTVVVGLPKGTVTDPNTTRIFEERWSLGSAFRLTPATGGLGGGLLGLGVAGVSWLAWRNGRDRRYSGSAVDAAFGGGDGSEAPIPLFDKPIDPVEFVPPEGVRPGHMGTLWDEQANPLDVSAMIVDLAVHGWLRIDELEPASAGTFGLGRSEGDFQLVKLRGTNSSPEGHTLSSAERTLLDSLFRDGPTQRLSELKTKFAERLALVESALYDDVVGLGWFATRPDRVRARWNSFGLVMVLLGAGCVFLAAKFTHFGLIAVPIPLVGLVLIGASRYFPARTARGSAMLGRTRGFKELFDAGEGERQNFAEHKHLFATYLPYAIVFGCTERWAKTFADLGLTPEDMGLGTWYTSPYGYDPIRFGWAMGSFTTQSTGTMAAAAPSSAGGASSGGSGFGGGFSGGGFGGGGGGSW